MGMRVYYTYQYLRAKEGSTYPAGTPYYIGKGQGRRALVSCNGHRPPKNQTLIRLQYWADEATAYAYERYLIEFWGRVDLGTGCLRNRTDGGEGTPTQSAQSRKLIGDANRRRVWSEGSRRKKSESQKSWYASNTPYWSGKKNSKLSDKLRSSPRSGASNPNFGNHKLAGVNHPMFGKKRPDVAQRNRERAKVNNV
jgi:hypothetical protein